MALLVQLGIGTAADPPALADQIYDHPSGIAQLNVLDGERSGFPATEPTANQNGE